MADYVSNYSGTQIDEAVGRVLLYGLGASAGRTLTANDSVDDAVETGWYTWPSNPADQPAGLPNEAQWHAGHMAVETTSAVLSKQTLSFITVSSVSNAGDHCVVQRMGRKSDGTWNPWEWVNPPVKLGVEYRTTERFLGKPVYVKAVSFGALPNNGIKDVSHNISNLSFTLAVYGESNGDNLIGNTYIDYCHVGSYNIRIKTNADRSTVSATVAIKYTKTTG